LEEAKIKAEIEAAAEEARLEKEQDGEINDETTERKKADMIHGPVAW
jgi:hypothetical protein